MALISDEIWASTIRRAIEIAKEHATDEERPRMERLYHVGLTDGFEDQDGTFGIIGVRKE
ncbi:MAG: hypothetical protein ACE363_13770 [Alphaproteobacteria bacterium]